MQGDNHPRIDSTHSGLTAPSGHFVMASKILTSGDRFDLSTLVHKPATFAASDSDLRAIVRTLDPDFVFDFNGDYICIGGTTELIVDRPSDDLRLRSDPHAYADQDSKLWGGAVGEGGAFCWVENFAYLDGRLHKIDAELRMLERKTGGPKRAFTLSLRVRLCPTTKQQYCQSVIKCRMISPGVKILAAGNHPPEHPFHDPVEISMEREQTVQANLGAAAAGVQGDLSASKTKRNATKLLAMDSMMTNIIEKGRQSITTIREAIRSTTTPTCSISVLRPRSTRSLQGDFYVTLQLYVPDHLSMIAMEYDFLLCRAGTFRDRNYTFSGEQSMNCKVDGGTIEVINDTLTSS